MKDIYWKGHTILLLISLLCCFPDFVYAYSLRQFSNKNGLSNSAIQSLYQDSQGVLWIGTCDGLNVFDGNNIHLYTPVDVSRNLLSGNIISQIVESEPGILWLNQLRVRQIGYIPTDLPDLYRIQGQHLLGTKQQQVHVSAER